MIKSQNIFTLFLLLYFCSSIGLKKQSILKEPLRSTVIDITVSNFYSYHNDSMNYVGRTGALVFLTDMDDEDEYYIYRVLDEKNITFQVNIKNIIGKNYTIRCRLGKLTDEPLLVFCELDEKIDPGNYSISFDTTFEERYTGTFVVHSNKSFCFFKEDEDIPLLYSNFQNLTVKENEKSIEIKMKIISYEEQTLLMENSKGIIEVLYDCETDITYDCGVRIEELICLIQKEKLLQIMSDKQEKFSIVYITSNYLIAPLPLVKEIEINYYGIYKEDLFVGITKLIDDKYDIFKGITYETNITNISNILMGFFSFSMKFENVTESECYFRKYENTPLLLVCIVNDYIEKTHLSKIEKEMILEDLNIKYNFRIQPVDNKETFNNFYSRNFFIQLRYPEILDFTYQDKLVITLGGYLNGNLKIRLNADAHDLKCEFVGSGIFLNCVVHKYHFIGKRSGYYSLIHVDEHLNEKTIFYEIPPFEVIVNDKDTDIIITVEEIYDNIDVIGKKGVIALETSFREEYNIFDEIDIEKRTGFTTTISNENKNKFIIKCNLFKFTDEP